MLHYFPENNINYAHKKRDYVIAAFTFICVAISLNVDASGSLENQNFMGVIAWIFLIGLLVGENKDVRTQVVIAVAFATVGESVAIKLKKSSPAKCSKRLRINIVDRSNALRQYFFSADHDLGSIAPKVDHDCWLFMYFTYTHGY